MHVRNVLQSNADETTTTTSLIRLFWFSLVSWHEFLLHKNSLIFQSFRILPNNSLLHRKPFTFEELVKIIQKINFWNILKQQIYRVYTISIVDYTSSMCHIQWTTVECQSIHQQYGCYVDCMRWSETTSVDMSLVLCVSVIQPT